MMPVSTLAPAISIRRAEAQENALLRCLHASHLWWGSLKGCSPEQVRPFLDHLDGVEEGSWVAEAGGHIVASTGWLKRIRGGEQPVAVIRATHATDISVAGETLASLLMRKVEAAAVAAGCMIAELLVPEDELAHHHAQGYREVRTLYLAHEGCEIVRASVLRKQLVPALSAVA